MPEPVVVDPAAEPVDPPVDPPAEGGEGEPEPVRDPEAIARNNQKLTDELKNTRVRLAELEADAEAKRVAALSEHEKAIETARKEAAAEVRSEFETQIAQERIRARATGVLVAPDDAVLYIDVADLDDSTPETIDAAIDELVKAKPHLKAKGAAKRGINQGPQGEPPTGDNPNDWIRRSLGRG